VKILSTQNLAVMLSLCIACISAQAAEEAPDPLLAKPLVELKRTVVSSNSEIDRILGAEAIVKLLDPPAPDRLSPVC